MDLVDASDFFPTLAEVAGFDIPEEWFTDGISFAPSLLDLEGIRRDHAFFWYDPRPGWDKDQFSRSIFALDHEYKLFDDGRMYSINGLMPVETELDTTKLSPAATAAKAELMEVIERMMKPPLSQAALSDPEEYAH